MTPADAKILAEELIALNALTNSSYVSNNGVLQQAKLAGIILGLVDQIEALEAPKFAVNSTYSADNSDVVPVTIIDQHDTAKPKRGRPTRRGNGKRTRRAQGRDYREPAPGTH